MPRSLRGLPLPQGSRLQRPAVSLSPAVEARLAIHLENTPLLPPNVSAKEPVSQSCPIRRAGRGKKAVDRGKTTVESGASGPLVSVRPTACKPMSCPSLYQGHCLLCLGGALVRGNRLGKSFRIPNRTRPFQGPAQKKPGNAGTPLSTVLGKTPQISSRFPVPVNLRAC